MRNPKRYLILITLLLNMSCNVSRNLEIEKVQEILSSYKRQLPSEAAYFVLVPLEGCGSCTKLAKNLIEMHANSKKIFFIISTYNTKNIRLYLGNSPKQYTNLLEDTQAKALKMGLISENPIILSTNDKNVLHKSLITIESIGRIKMLMK